MFTCSRLAGQACEIVGKGYFALEDCQLSLCPSVMAYRLVSRAAGSATILENRVMPAINLPLKTRPGQEGECFDGAQKKGLRSEESDPMKS